ncbi:hypothetical protein BH11PAT4_BH11PAT4_0550 [soil metagenome]
MKPGRFSRRWGELGQILALLYGFELLKKLGFILVVIFLIWAVFTGNITAGYG